MSEDINVTDGTVLESLNNKVDLDGGNYKGSELEAYIHEHCGGGGLEIGDIGIAPLGIDETKGKRRYLNGQLIIQDQYVQFTNKVKSAVALYPSLACTEEEWQATALLTVGGQVGKFVVDDNAGTIRLPKIIMPIQGLTDLSKLAEIVEAGLPNITGEFVGGNQNGTVSGALVKDGNSKSSQEGSSYKEAQMSFDASLSNPTYGNSNTVQQEQIQYPYFIQVATGSETEDNIVNEIELNNPFSLLDYKFSEYELNNISWLRSNNQFEPKTTYPAVYDLLLKIYNGTETKAGVSVKLFGEEYTEYDFVLNTAEETFRLPVKVKLASGKAIAGNGMALGITQGLDDEYRTLWFDSANSNRVNINCIDEPVVLPNNTTSGTQTATNHYNIGITTDSTKSGIETSDNGLYLYFYVGETVQNANLINAGRIEEKLTLKADKTDVDGQWVYKYHEVFTGTTLGATPTGFDISDYLPDDTNSYEVQLFLEGSNSTSGTAMSLYLDAEKTQTLFKGRVFKNSDLSGANGVIVFLNGNRTIYAGRDGSINIANGRLTFFAYRRLGTNK